MRQKTFNHVFAADFETTTYDGIEFTEVWASGLCELNTEDVKIFHSLPETWEYIRTIKGNVLLYYHNLKFDGSFWLPFLLDVCGYKQAYLKRSGSLTMGTWLKDVNMINRSFKYSISDRGQWYYILIREGNRFIEIRDSLKLLPFSLKNIGKSFKTKHQKLDMEYTGFRYAGCEITPDEQKYLENDVFVLKEALEIMYQQGHYKLTIGSCCMTEYRKITGKKHFGAWFPDMVSFPLDANTYGYFNADEYIRRSYRGGWCYVMEGKERTVYKEGCTADVNSLYPSVMSSESGSIYPVGLPTFWTGNYIPDEAKAENKYYFVRIRTRFYLKDGYLPFIQIKGNWLYRGTECLKTSDVRIPGTNKYSRYYRDQAGTLQDSAVTITFTMVDLKLFLEHYNVEDFEILDGCYFDARRGIFDEYIDKYKKIKLTAKGAIRQLAKLFLNNLYGKMASNTDSSFKYAWLDDDGIVQYFPVDEANKKAGYIPVGSAVTSYARNFTIRAAQKNYDNFIYADTDSIHCHCKVSELKGIKVHPVDFCCWKVESYWDFGWYVRQKTYIEHITHEDGKPVTPYYNVKCAGMPDKCKDLFIKSVEGGYNLEDYEGEEKEFLDHRRKITDFDIGLKVPGKLMPKRIKGGTILINTFYEMRKI